MNITIDEVYTFKLLTGEETIAKVTEIAQEYYLIKQPINAIITAQGLQLMPGLFTANADKLVQLNTRCIAMIAEPREDVRSSYIQATTGIAPISRQIITG
jgi:hypothetical protein